MGAGCGETESSALVMHVVFVPLRSLLPFFLLQCVHSFIRTIHHSFNYILSAPPPRIKPHKGRDFGLLCSLCISNN